MKSPNYIHDCDKCKYHGSFFSEEHNRNYEVYTCLQECVLNTILILRYGSEGPEYLSTNVGFISKQDLDSHYPHYKKAVEIIFGKIKKNSIPELNESDWWIIKNSLEMHKKKLELSGMMDSDFRQLYKTKIEQIENTLNKLGKRKSI